MKVASVVGARPNIIRLAAVEQAQSAALNNQVTVAQALQLIKSAQAIENALGC